MSNNSIDHRALQSILGSVIEAAIRDQKTAEKMLAELAAAIGTLRSTSNSLPNVVSGQVKQQIEGATDQAATTLLERFNEANSSAELATAVYDRAAKRGLRLIVLPALGITALCALSIAAAAAYFTPSLSEIQERRQEHANLVGEIEYLDQLKKIEFRRCQIGGNEFKICAKLNAQNQKYMNGYRVLSEKVISE